MKRKPAGKTKAWHVMASDQSIQPHSHFLLHRVPGACVGSKTVIAMDGCRRVSIGSVGFVVHGNAVQVCKLGVAVCQVSSVYKPCLQKTDNAFGRSKRGDAALD